MNQDDLFVEEYRPLVRSVAHRLRSSLDLDCDLDDLISFGYRGLLEAKKRYDPDRGVQFNTFAYYRVRGAILDGIRGMAYMPRRAHALLRAASADRVAEEAAAERSARRPLEPSAQTRVKALDDALGRLTASFVIASLGQSQEDVGGNPEEGVMRADTAGRVRAALSHLPPRERALIEGFYFRGRRFDEVAHELGISKSWASRLHGKALEMLRQYLADERNS